MAVRCPVRVLGGEPCYYRAVNKPSSTRGKRLEPPASRYRVQVLDRTIAVLQAVADSDTDVAAADIARQLRLHKSTVHRLLVVLEHYRLIKKGPQGAYRLGTRLIELGDCAAARLISANAPSRFCERSQARRERARTSRFSAEPRCSRSRTSKAAGACIRSPGRGTAPSFTALRLEKP